MRRLALNRCLRAAPSETLLAAVFVCLLIVLLRNDAHAQFLPSGCPGQWVQGGGGMMCLCPDGTYANMVGNQIVCPSRVQTQPQVGDYCSNGGTCGVGYKCSWMPGKCVPEGKVDCGEYFCQSGQTCSSDPTYRHCLSQGEVDCGSYHCSAGYKCSSAKCIAQDAVDCGNGSYCSAGRKCSPDGKLCIGINEVDCGSYRCSPGLKCGSGNICLHRDWVDCGGGKSCAPGQVCVNGGSECLTSAQIADRKAAEAKQKAEAPADAAGLPNIEQRPVRRNYQRVIEALRDIGAWIRGGAAEPFPSVPVDVLVIGGGTVLGGALLLIYATYRLVVRRPSRTEPVFTYEEPNHPETGSAPSERHAAPSVASEPHDMPTRSAPHRDSPWAVHSKADVKKTPWAATPKDALISTPPVASAEPSVSGHESEAFTRAEFVAHRERQVAEEIAVPNIERLDSRAVPNAGLLIASMVLGIIGGATGLLIALFGYTIVGAAGALSGQGSQAALVQLLLIASPIASIVGAAIVRSKPPAGAILMGASMVPLLLFFGFNFFTMLPIVLSGLGAALAVLAIVQANSKTH